MSKYFEGMQWFYYYVVSDIIEDEDCDFKMQMLYWDFYCIQTG